ncbi:hypothetical protein E2C11_16300 [Streptomyces lavendulae]|nr:hypothetical protein [Streptomyces lavendulae]TXJ78568.1 hypothetical protein E2C11_16300 [Streptomyces lavendulae]
MALESAQLLQSPERAAEVEQLRVERDGFCDRVDTLTAVARGNKRHVAALVVELEKVQRERDGALARVAELEAERHSTNEALDDAVQELRARRDAEVVDRSVEKLTRMLAPSQVEDPHDSPLHHQYALGRDLPPLGGVS